MPKKCNKANIVAIYFLPSSCLWQVALLNMVIQGHTFFPLDLVLVHTHLWKEKYIQKQVVRTIFIYIPLGGSSHKSILSLDIKSLLTG